MRQVGDTLVWLGLIVLVAAVLYFTPRVASYVSTREAPPAGKGRVAWSPAGVALEAAVERSSVNLARPGDGVTQHGPRFAGRLLPGGGDRPR